MKTTDFRSLTFKWGESSRIKSVKSTVLNTPYSGVLKCGLLISVKIGRILEQEVKQRLFDEMPLFSTLSDNTL